MQYKKRWQFWLIIIVILLTIYNILPTVFYYTKPLKKPVDLKRAENISKGIVNRINSLEKDSILWLKSYCKMLKINPSSIEINKMNPQLIDIEFYKAEDANLFKKNIQRAGNLISFVPSQLIVTGQNQNLESKKVIVQRRIPMNFDVQRLNDFFEFTSKYDQKKNISEFYKEIVFDRASEIGSTVAGVSENALLVENIIKDSTSIQSKNMIYTVVHNIIDFTTVFGQNSNISNRFFASFTQGNLDNPRNAIQSLIEAISNLKNEIRIEKSKLKDEEKNNKFLSDDLTQKLYLLDKRQDSLTLAETILKNNLSKFSKQQTLFTYNDIYSKLHEEIKQNPAGPLKINLQARNPFISQIVLDFSNDKIFLEMHKDIVAFEENLTQKNKDLFDQLIINEIARISNQTSEKLSSHKDELSISLHQLEESKSYLVLKLSQIADIISKQTLNILNDWNPTNPDLSKDNFPIYDYATYQKLPAEQKRLCLVVYAPVLQNNHSSYGMHSNSIYIIAKGIDEIQKKYSSNPKSNDAKSFIKDFENLSNLLNQNGYVGFSGDILSKSSEFKNDFIFENDDYYQTLINASRENFQVFGSKKYAILEFSNVGQRIATINKIETSIQENLLKWQDDYNAAQVSLDTSVKYDFPPPTKNVLFNNLKLSTRKYFRGDERKIVQWGLDLSGGKTVQIELRDQNNHIVKDEAALKQGINELYNRVNKMGVSEVNIRLVDSYIVLDFPGAQGLSAQELVKASSMSFHVVNEKFSINNSSLSDHVNKFLQEIWNEAVVTNKKDIQSINEIAYRHLYGKSLSSDDSEPVSESAKILHENGLRLAFNDEEVSSAFNDTISKIAMFKGDDFSQWHSQTNPLVIIFNNYALEGSNLTNIRASYDPGHGNFLSFEVKGSYSNKENVRINPRDELYTWTSQFSQEKITGTPLESYSRGQGWRMAVILNDYIISAPTLKADFKDSAMITGSFSLREVNQLAADLKAGSLTFTPNILSEKNVSPELGSKERVQGIIATFAALIIVMVAMIYYYRFAGIVASVAVFFNLLIMWATLQNLHATLTLAGIAGIILTVGMSVDANVLVFERIREDFEISKKISSAIQSGYKRAFSAILDSNLTTIIAALILLNFDAGPIKGFAITLIIGIASSFFTALFMTKYFFTKWAQNPHHTKLRMLNFIKTKNFNYLKYSKYVFIGSALIILIGGYTLGLQRKSIFGMDFTGGFSINIEVEKNNSSDYRAVVEKALIKNGASSYDFNVRELNPSNNIRILFGTSMNENGKPFYGMPLDVTVLDKQYNYQTNPRINWVVESLEKDGIKISQRSLDKLDQNWSVVSGQMSDSMRNNAIWGLVLALVAIFIYLTFRFEFKYSISAMICLIHDVVFTIAIISILYMFKMPLQIDMNTVAALMTIIGYSLNDTIVIFDRIRDDVKHMKKITLKELINHSLNVTLSRTTITSGTTILALLALVVLGGSTIFNFAFVMTIGVVFGTLSSIFIASPLLLMFHNIELKKSMKMMNQEK
ncbi:MAG: protein translocase subunit SecD [Parachlamydiales bacterium]|jgi:SecD/SecF fusion protein